jgi:hypothetical protein
MTDERRDLPRRREALGLLGGLALELLLTVRNATTGVAT